MGIAQIVPVTGRAALRWVAETHRHLPNLQGALFAVGVAHNERLVGVGTAGNPPRVWLGTGRFVITRVAVLPRLPNVRGGDGREHAFPGCTMLYRALCDAGRSLGYREAWTYTLPWESGRSLRAAGFTDMGLTKAEEWDRPSRRRRAAVQPEAKRRWMRALCKPRRLGGKDAGAANGRAEAKATGTGRHDGGGE